MTAAPSPSFDGQDRPVSLRPLMLIIGVALLLRIVWALLVPVVPQSDVLAYDTFARNLVEHGVFGWTPQEPFSFWPPGTSFFYATVYWLAGYNPINIVLANLAVTVGMLMCSARVVTRFFGAQTGLWSTALLAVWPTFVTLSTLLVSEPLFIFLIVAALDAWTAPRMSIWARGMLAGVCLGAATLVRPQAMLLSGLYAFGMLIYAGWSRQQVKEQILLAVLAGVVLLVVVSPWTWRNYQLYGEFVLVSTNGGATFWMGNSPGSDGEFMLFPEHVKGLTDYERNKVLSGLAFEYIKQDPLAFLTRTFMKVIRLYNNESIGVLWNQDALVAAYGAEVVTPLKRLAQASWAFIFLLTLMGAGLLVITRGGWRLLLSPLPLTMLFFTVVHAIVISGGRYHLVCAVPIAALGGHAISTLLQKRRSASPVALSKPPLEARS